MPAPPAVDRSVVAALLTQSDIGRLRTLVGPREDALLALTDFDGTVIWVSPAGCQSLLGRQPGEVIASCATSWVHPQDRRRVNALVSDATSQGQSADTVHRLAPARGRVPSVRTFCWPRHSPAGLRCLVHIVVLAATGGDRRSAA